MKKYFFLKLIPPRPSFAMDMTPEERSVMLKHIDYWREHMKNGSVVVFGPMMDPSGPYGMGVVKVDSEEEVKTFMLNDPAATINRYEHFPMRAVTPDQFT